MPEPTCALLSLSCEDLACINASRSNGGRMHQQHHEIVDSSPFVVFCLTLCFYFPLLEECKPSCLVQVVTRCIGNPISPYSGGAELTISRMITFMAWCTEIPYDA